MTKNVKSRMMFAMLMLVTCMGAAASADNQMLSVTYLRREWNGTEVDTTSVTEDIPAVPSDGSMTGGKYFLGSNVTVNDRIYLTGSTELILGDGFTLDVKGLYIPAGSTLSVYGQANGTGRLEAGSVISRSGAVNVYGGELSTGSISISDEKSLIIKNGKLAVKGNVSCGNLDISGGVTSIGGQASAETITLGCGDLDDSITIGAYDSDSISVAEGQTLRGDNGTDYSGTLGSSSAAGQTLRLTQFFTVFDTAEFTLPAQLIRVEDSAFEGLDVKSVYIPDGCTSIGIYAFKGCTNLIRIRIPAGCTVGADAFIECEKVYIFGSVGSSAEYYCRNHSNCVFVAETQN